MEVAINVGINFHIGKTETREEDCKKFLYYLGPVQLEEMLYKTSEEAIRNFIRSIKVSRVRDIKSEVTS